MPERPPSPWEVGQALAVARSVAQRLGAEPSDGDDIELFVALAAEDADPSDVLRRLGRAVLEAEANVDALKERIARLQDRQARFDGRADAYRGSIHAILNALGRTKFTDAEFTAYVSESKGAVLITDEAKLAPEYLVTTPPRPDRTKIGKDLRDGVVVDGASLSNGQPILTLKSR